MPSLLALKLQRRQAASAKAGVIIIYSMNIVLIGYRGAGKSAVGRKLAERLQRGFVDTDDLIEADYGAPISKMVISHGWNHFRRQEKRIIKEISKENNLIIATGGGAVLDTDNVNALRRNGFIIWLKAASQVLLKRIINDPQTFDRRPSLKGNGVLEEIEEVLAFRNGFYEEAAAIQLDTSDMDVEAAVEHIVAIFDEKASNCFKGSGVV